MLTYMALPYDDQAERSAKLKALQGAFGEGSATAFNMLPADAMSPNNKARGTQLIINSHGNDEEFGDYTPRQFLDQLKTKGFRNGSFSVIRLLACEVGLQSQKNTILENFSREFKQLLNNDGIDAKVYAPRGDLAYSMTEKQASGQKYYEVTRIYIDTPEREYPLDEGMLLVTLA